MKQDFILTVYLKLLIVILVIFLMVKPVYAEKSIEPNTLGDRVVVLQKELITRGYLNDVADGAYGPKTQEAVANFQRDNGLDPTGTADEQTLFILFPNGINAENQSNNTEDSNTLSDSKQANAYRFLLDVKFIGNLFLSTYDVDVYIDNVKIESLPHGTDLLVLIENVSEGAHFLSFRSAKNADVEGKYLCNIIGDATFRCEIKCHSDNIELEEKDLDYVDLSFIPDGFLSVNMEKPTEGILNNSTEKSEVKWCEYGYANRFISDWNYTFPAEKINSNMIVENEWLGAEIRLNDFVSFNVGEIDGTTYYEAFSYGPYENEKRELFVKYANKMILASEYYNRFIDLDDIGDYPGEVTYKEDSFRVDYDEYTGTGKIYNCRIQAKLFSGEW